MRLLISYRCREAEEIYGLSTTLFVYVGAYMCCAGRLFFLFVGLRVCPALSGAGEELYGAIFVFCSYCPPEFILEILWSPG